MVLALQLHHLLLSDRHDRNLKKGGVVLGGNPQGAHPGHHLRALDTHHRDRPGDDPLEKLDAPLEVVHTLTLGFAHGKASLLSVLQPDSEPVIHYRHHRLVRLDDTITVQKVHTVFGHRLGQLKGRPRVGRNSAGELDHKARLVLIKMIDKYVVHHTLLPERAEDV